MTFKNLFIHPETRILRPGWRIPWLILWVLPLVVAISGLVTLARRHVPSPWLPAARALLGLALILGALAIYRWFIHRVEHRVPLEAQVDPNTPWHVGLGFLLGGGAMLLITAILALAGAYRIEGFHSPWLLLRAAIFYLPQSFSEDFFFCLILFRPLREGIGRRPALVVAPLLFALAHMGNPNESVLGIAEIVTSGMVMYYAFDRTDRFWTIWALHFSWNFTMNGVLGMANSGLALQGWIRPTITGPAWLTGEATGPEASALAVGLDLLLLLLLLSRMSAQRLRGPLPGQEAA
ncbi:CPBP family intramembrane glutamic endopeptidase [Geothrix sp. PMB-07]|uniref:CPBP family intramembrane glutamic endopeptidase n=1 Tax=Geothrix sp. PMB-07 TaxID=3068640 RepID=UPI00274189DE|nr:CPBP family intramembrane glutamic endopeptidase [Geothrix sp. PMB-07]WLT31868.1 CPBP family intramembrane metalloprotease [Geothrix sp. PMB-07]